MIAQLERGVQSEQNLLSATQKAREEMSAAEASHPRRSLHLRLRTRCRKICPSTIESPESVIRSYAPSVCLIHVSVGFVDKNSGQPLRYGGIGPDGPYKDSEGNVVYTLEGRGPEVRADFFGTGFIVGPATRSSPITMSPSHGGRTMSLSHVTQQGLQPAVATMNAYFPESPNGIHVEIAEISKDADLALLTGNLSGLKRSTLKLDPRKEAAVSGQPLISLGYPTGLSAILARASDDAVQEIVKITAGDPKGVIEELARRELHSPDGHARPHRRCSGRPARLRRPDHFWRLWRPAHQSVWRSRWRDLCDRSWLWRLQLRGPDPLRRTAAKARLHSALSARLSAECHRFLPRPPFSVELSLHPISVFFCKGEHFHETFISGNS